MLKIYIDRRWLAAGERLLPLARFLFAQKEFAMPTFRDEFAINMQFHDIELVDEVPACDFIFLPVNHEPELVPKHASLIEDMEAISTGDRKKVVVQAHTKDILEPGMLGLPFSNCVYLNSALLKARSGSNFSSLPYFVPDCLGKYNEGKISLLEKEALPGIGFCGVAPPLRTPMGRTKILDLLRLLLTCADDLGADSEKIARLFGTNIKHGHRCKALLVLMRSSLVKSDFIFRSESGFANHAYSNLDDFNPYNVEFYDNLNRNLYSLCSRGTENYSVRFYETFCMGRIPVLIDTDVCLPFDSEIDYSAQCVIVDKIHVRNVDRCVSDFHNSRTEKQLQDIQLGNRKIWENYFSNSAFYKELGRRIQDGGCQANNTQGMVSPGLTTVEDKTRGHRHCA